jgi:mutator protein MutT
MSDFAPANPAPDTARTDVAIAVIQRSGKVLICQRKGGGSFAGYWEFPGGKREPPESIIECLEREIREELGIEVEPDRALQTIDHDYPAGRIRLHPYLCTSHSGEPQALAARCAKWVEPPDLKHHQFPPANDELIDEVIASLTEPLPAPPRDDRR